MPDFDLSGELSLKIELHMLRPITEKVHSGNGPVSLVSFVHRKAGQNSKSMANVFVSQKFLTQIQLAKLTLLKNNYYRKPNLEFC